MVTCSDAAHVLCCVDRLLLVFDGHLKERNFDSLSKSLKGQCKVMPGCLKASAIAFEARLSNRYYAYIDLGPRAHVIGLLRCVTIVSLMLIVV